MRISKVNGVILVRRIMIEETVECMRTMSVIQVQKKSSKVIQTVDFYPIEDSMTLL